MMKKTFLWVQMYFAKIRAKVKKAKEFYSMYSLWCAKLDEAAKEIFTKVLKERQ